MLDLSLAMWNYQRVFGERSESSWWNYVGIMIILMIICNTNSNDNIYMVGGLGHVFILPCVGQLSSVSEGLKPPIVLKLEHLKLDTCFSIMEMEFFGANPNYMKRTSPFFGFEFWRIPVLLSRTSLLWGELWQPINKYPIMKHIYIYII